MVRAFVVINFIFSLILRRDSMDLEYFILNLKPNQPIPCLDS